MVTLWKTMILPKLEYCCQLWSNHTIQDITTLEAIQRTFTSRIQGVQHMNYWERLSHLKLYSLQRRRERYIAIYVWKILEAIVPTVGLQENTQPRRGRLCYVRSTLGTTHKVCTLVHNSFTYNGTSIFNSLPREIRDHTGTSLESFKRTLDKWLSRIPDEPPTPGYSNFHHNTLPEITRRTGAADPGTSGGPPQLCQ